ncbi:MAG: SDR family NAD(P)-dependent oxidoreductase [Endozoicomonadaceae bacterium]|nr:SDR family NAD(P)-dependent oxidoreductase [Endozoicomonadaceae bacterium]
MKLILLIGFSRGLGKALFEQLLISLEPEELELIAVGRNTENLPKYNGVTYKQADLSKDDCWNSLLEFILDNINDLDIFLNASVVEPINRVGTLDSYLLGQAVQVNYLSPMKLINEIISLQQKSNFHINVFNISSGAASKAIDGWSVYCSTKAALKMYLDVACIETGDTFAVTHIDPGVIDTDMQKVIRSKSAKEMKGVQQFINLSSDNLLKSPEVAALDVLKKSGLY